MIVSPAKRRSVHGYTLGIVYPVADGSISAADRANVAWLYSGLFVPDIGGALLALLSLTPVLAGTLVLTPVVAALAYQVEPVLTTLLVQTRPVLNGGADAVPALDAHTDLQAALDGESRAIATLTALAVEWRAALDGMTDAVPVLTALTPEMECVLAGSPVGKPVLDSSGGS